MALGGAFAAFQAGKSIVNAGMQVQALQNRMLAATGDINVAADAMAFARAEAERLGLDVRATADGFAGFSASALRAGLTLQQTKDIFTGVSEAATSMHLSVDQTQLVFKALEQMAGKGTVSMEELRGQLGDVLPGAFEIAAKSAGKTTAEFAKLVADGKVLSTEFLPGFGQAIRRELGGSLDEATNSAQAAFNRLGNAFFDLQSRLASSGFLDSVVTSVQSLTSALNDPELVAGLSAFVSMLSKAIEIAVRAAAAIGRAASAISSAVEAVGNSAFGSLFGKAGTEALDKARGVADSVKSAPVRIAVSPTYSLGAVSEPVQSDAQKKAAEKAARLRDQLSGQVDGLKGQFASPEERAGMDLDDQQKLLEEALEAKAITEQEYRDLSLKSEMAYQEELAKIRQQAWEDDQSALEGFLGVRIRSEDQMQQDSLSSQGASFRQSIAQAAQHNKAFFQLEKAAAIARALISARESVVSAYAFGSRIGGPVLGAAFAGVAAAAQVANIAAIASTSYGGGGASVSSGGGGGSSGASDSSSGVQNSDPYGSTKNINVTLVGNDMASWSKNQVREFIDLLNDAAKDGSRLQVQLA